ncbi:MAG: VWA domain-containing protein [Oscillospiraceae bacterium]|nr:VWA domain-containing protein [Oscillospiraceae bacterium]
MQEKHNSRRFLSILLSFFLGMQPVSGVASSYDVHVTAEDLLAYDTSETIEIFQESETSEPESFQEEPEIVCEEEPESLQEESESLCEEEPELPFGEEEPPTAVKTLQPNLFPAAQASNDEGDTTTYVIIRYHHADSDTIEYRTAELKPGQSLTVSSTEKMLDTESYTGYITTAGNPAITTSGNDITVTWTDGITLAKAEVFYSEKMKEEDGGTVNNNGYDTMIKNDGTKVYDTSRQGLHTDKTAETVQDNARAFDLTLESWYVGKSADVTMILDASGSMAWPIDSLEELEVDPDLNFPKNQLLTQEQVDQIMDKNYTDNTKLQYSDYYYFIYDDKNDEHVALGYGTVTAVSTGKGGKREVTGSNGNVVGFSFNSPTQTTSSVPADGKSGWYYVTTTSTADFKTGSPYSMKFYMGFEANTKSSSGQETINLLDYDELKNDKVKMEDGTTPLTITKDDTARFYIDDNNVLKCIYSYGDYLKTGNTNIKDSNGKNIRQTRLSSVYIYPNSGSDLDSPALTRRNHQIKTEALQEGIGIYQSIINAEMPSNRTSIVKFSDSKLFKDIPEELIVLDWTSDSQKILTALSQSYGTTDDVQGNEISDNNQISQYNYYLTGGTYAYTGVKSFMDNLQNSARSNTESDKYLVLFTDGRDQEKTKEGTDNITTYINTLKAAGDKKGYKIITVFLRSDGMSNTDVNASENFLRGLASTVTLNNGDQKTMYYQAVSSNQQQSSTAVMTLREIFEDIAETISNALQDYTIRDYIDPRFDLLDANGNPVTVLKPDGTFEPCEYTTQDGKTANLCYDDIEKMFYLEWENQNIPLVKKNTSNVNTKENIWFSTIRVQAKEDFIGGNHILTNGNEAGQNRVYYPAGNNIDNTQNHDKYPAKDFPKTTVNPAVLEVSLKNQKDTFFLGETFTKDDLKKYFEDMRASDNVYLKYLERLALSENQNKSYYINQLLDGVLNAQTLQEFPYRYFADPETAASYAGDSEHENERIGKLTYQWVECTADGIPLDTQNGYNGHTFEDTDSKYYYKLAVTYTPDTVSERAGEFISYHVQNPEPNLKRDPVGTQQAEKTITGNAEIDVVSGKLQIDKRLNLDELPGIIDEYGSRELKFHVMRTYNEETTEYASVTMTLTKEKAVINGNRSDGITIPEQEISLTGLSKDTEGYITIQSGWLEKLPIGVYTITEEKTVPYVLAEAETITPAKNPCDVVNTSFYIGITEDESDPDSSDIFERKPYLAKQAGEIKLLNERVFQIPSTGGHGDFLFIITGTAMLTAAWLRKFGRKRPTGKKRFTT